MKKENDLQSEASTSQAVVAEQEPELYVAGIRVTERDVTDALLCEGDEVLAAYRAGRITKADAYARAQYRNRQLLRLLGSGDRDLHAFGLLVHFFRTPRKQ